MSESARKYRLAAKCPGCSRQPVDRYTSAAVLRARDMPLDEEFKDVKCRCGCAYRIAWVALAYAEPVADTGKPPPDLPWAA